VYLDTECAGGWISEKLFHHWLEQEILFVVCRLPLGSVNPHIQWLSEILHMGKCGWSKELTTHLRLMPILRLSGAIPPPPQVSLDCLHQGYFTV
jgi:hypothetical protein